MGFHPGRLIKYTDPKTHRKLNFRLVPQISSRNARVQIYNTMAQISSIVDQKQWKGTLKPAVFLKGTHGGYYKNQIREKIMHGYQ